MHRVNFDLVNVDRVAARGKGKDFKILSAQCFKRLNDVGCARKTQVKSRPHRNPQTTARKWVGTCRVADQTIPTQTSCAAHDRPDIAGVVNCFDNNYSVGLRNNLVDCLGFEAKENSERTERHAETCCLTTNFDVGSQTQATELRNLQMQSLGLFGIAQHDFRFVATIKCARDDEITLGDEPTGGKC